MRLAAASLNVMLGEAEQRRAARQHINKYNTDQTEGLLFKDVRHFRNHLAYLFRTDAAQKWTNSFTFGNVYFLCEGGQWKAFRCRSLEARQQLNDIVYLSSRGLDIRDLRMARLDYEDRSVISYTGQVGRDTADVIHNLEKKLSPGRVLTFVIHVDQEGCYIHLHIIWTTVH